MRKFRLWLARKFIVLAIWVAPRIVDDLIWMMATDRNWQFRINEAVNRPPSFSSREGDAGKFMEELLEQRAKDDPKNLPSNWIR